MDMRIKVGPYRYLVTEDFYRVTHKDFKSKKDLGFCDHQQQIIYVKADQGPEYKQVTLLHECLHAILDSVNLNTMDKREERWVEAMAPLLLSLLKENPELVKTLTEEF